MKKRTYLIKTKLYKKKYYIALYDKNDELCYVFQSVDEMAYLTGLDYDNIMSRLGHILYEWKKGKYHRENINLYGKLYKLYLIEDYDEYLDDYEWKTIKNFKVNYINA